DQARAALEARTLTEVASPTLRDRWEQGRTSILDRYTQSSDLSELGAAASRLEQRINDARAAIPLPPSDVAVPPGADATALRDALIAEREAALGAAWDTGDDAAFAAALSDQGQRIGSLYQSVRAAGADLALGDAGLGAGVGWRDSIPGASAGRTLESIAASWATTESQLPEAVAAALRPSAQRLTELGDSIARVEQTGDPGALAALVLDDQSAVQTRLAAWDRLAPGSFLGVDTESQMLQRLRADAGAIADQARRDGLTARLNQRATALWASRMDAAGTRPELAQARDLAGTLGIGFDGTALSARARFNIGLNTAIERAEQVAQNAGATDDEYRRALQSILDVANRPVNQALWAGDQAMADWITTIREAAAPPTGGGDLATVGPGTVGWRYQNTDPSGQRATYVSPGGVTLEFARIDLPTGQGVFLQTTEISADAFGRAADQGGFWNELEAQWSGSASDVINGTDWPGPAVWTYDRNQPGRLAPNSIWLRAQRPSGPTRAVANAFPPGFGERPSLDMPMQQVTANAARLFAQRVGCRLPTVSEWRAAAQREPTSGWNVRDQVWLNQRNHAAANQRQTPTVPFPDEGAFAENFDVPAETGASATPATSASDGTLYFQPVTAGPGATFKHIIGNVWEFVLDNGRVYVVGQSSLSPPEWGTNPVEVPDFLLGESRYPDVGFRLAFDAPPPSAGADPLRDRARQILRNAVLVAPSP
ncbi:MAG: SUMF1/EgtB/PvdO family nonheme iron enzyme, partial [Phycisphaerales bacterium]|nr:SUMF1/EgtB/PvdO family nonheme iron enzyme [Phycisphaerales bacterium]